MSKDYMQNDFRWNQFAATGSVFDYLNYKHVNIFGNGDLCKGFKYDRGGNCEDRDKRGDS